MASVLEILDDHGDIPANLADLQEHLGGIPIERISMMPPPGTATEEDLWRWKYCELLDRVIVVKATNVFKSCLSSELLFALADWNKASGDHGYVFPGLAYRFSADVIRLPDISYVSPTTWGDRRLSDELPDFTPDLTIDFIVPDNTQQEMQRKRSEYIEAGVQLIWTIDTIERVVWVTRPDATPTRSQCLGQDDQLTAPDLLPGFALSIGGWFREAEEPFRS